MIVYPVCAPSELPVDVVVVLVCVVVVEVVVVEVIEVVEVVLVEVVEVVVVVVEVIEVVVVVVEVWVIVVEVDEVWVIVVEVDEVAVPVVVTAAAAWHTMLLRSRQHTGADQMPVCSGSIHPCKTLHMKLIQHVLNAVMTCILMRRHVMHTHTHAISYHTVY